MAIIKTNESSKFRATVVNSRQGLVNLDGQLEGSNQFRSMSLSKYPDGAVLELVFRVTNKGQRQLVSYDEILATDRYRLVVVDFDNDHISLAEIVAWSAEALGVQESKITANNTGNMLPYTILRGLNYRDAATYREGLNAKADDRCIFDTIKHTPEDMPTEVDQEVSGAMSLEFVDGIYIPDHLRPLFDVATHVIQEGSQFNALLLGESGYGKTSMFEALARHLGIGFLRKDCSLIQDTTEWYGSQRAQDGSTFFATSEFTEAVMTGNCVILLDEANRIEPQLSNSLFPLLDHARRVVVQGVEIVCGPGIIFGHTMNVGVKYAGTNVVDSAWLNRMDFVDEVGELPADVEVEMLGRRHPRVPDITIKRVVSAMGALRKVVAQQQLNVDVSTRSSHKVLRLVEFGMDVRSACRYTIETVCPLDERKAIIDVLNNRLGVS